MLAHSFVCADYCQGVVILTSTAREVFFIVLRCLGSRANYTSDAVKDTFALRLSALHFVSLCPVRVAASAQYQ